MEGEKKTSQSGLKSGAAKKGKVAAKSKSKPAKSRGTSKPSFPAAEIHYQLTVGRNEIVVKPEVSLYLSAVVEYLRSEVIEKAGNHAIDRHSKTIEIEDIMAAIEADEELNELLNDVVRNVSSNPPK